STFLIFYYSNLSMRLVYPVREEISNGAYMGEKVVL
ncbi:MAG: hypothetical protein FD151_1756, partial [bacterium]